MSVLLITFDHAEPSKDPAGLLTYIHAYDYTQIDERSFVIDTSKNPMTVVAELRPMLENDDACYVITLRKPHCVHGSGEVNDWLNQRLTW